MTPAAAELPLPAHKSLRAKAWFATLALLAFLLGSAMYIANERGKIYDSIQSLEELAEHEKALALAEAAINGALIDASEASSAAITEPPPPSEMRLYMESCKKLMSVLEPFDPAYALIYRAIERSFDSLEAAPVRANWIDLRQTLGRAADDLEIRRARLVAARDEVTKGYQRLYDAVTIESLGLATVGLLAFGTLAGWFFARLSADVRRLEAHARHIVRGGRGVTLDVQREDELGRLMHAVNRMAVDLDEREKQIKVDGQRRSHQDKMLAVGALAAGLAHEVNNPLAVITGLAQELTAAPQHLSPGDLAVSAQMILTQAQRASLAARHLAEAAAPQPAELDWVDLNAMVQQAVQLMGYDRRYRAFDFEVNADPALPAVRTVGNAIQQVLMQLLALGCDAMRANSQAPAKVSITTAEQGGQVEVSLLFPSVMDFTRAEVQNSLLLNRAIAEPLGARLALRQVEGPRLRITLGLPSPGGEERG
jgi:two-component system, NtrC family, sensor kinase